MSPLMSIPGPSLRSELIQPGHRRRRAPVEALHGFVTDTEVLQEPRQHLVGVEVLLGDLARCPRVALVVSPDLLHPRCGLVEGREDDEAFSRRIEMLEARVLAGPACRRRDSRSLRSLNQPLCVSTYMFFATMNLGHRSLDVAR